MIEVQGEKGLERDPFSKAIVRTDVDVLAEHRVRRATLRRSIMNADRVEQLEAELKELKLLVQQLINK